ncbi:MAG: hypothetical protein KatS3mg033_0866 [Thermonema sp.]|uniref:DUF2141 domain-containing protein n=1 Tax=Thermonema sp. TaxID=2231181 RepID=UPI0021DC7735|nr:DUF2141 domain-containing protein [Thermonema sp.]GIV39066.1 MAG: hypothetical protein KatS3mg033_0866 [Thermonema sp.]
MNRYILSKLAFLFFLMMGNAQESPAQNRGNLHIEITNLRNHRGHVLVSLFAEEGKKGFPDEPAQAYRKAKVPIENLKAVVHFENLPHGTYAVAVLHDENDNGKMDKNFLGIPTEGFAFSNNVRPVFGPPSFHKAAFELNRRSKTLLIKMLYF